MKLKALLYFAYQDPSVLSTSSQQVALSANKNYLLDITYFGRILFAPKLAAFCSRMCVHILS